MAELIRVMVIWPQQQMQQDVQCRLHEAQKQQQLQVQQQMMELMRELRRQTQRRDMWLEEREWERDDQRQVWTVKLNLYTEGGNTEDFLPAFEHSKKMYKIPEEEWMTKLRPTLTGKARPAFANYHREQTTRTSR